MRRLNIIDGNNVMFRLLQRSSSWEALIRNARAYSADQTYWVWDGTDSRAPRRAKYPEYKANRNTRKKPVETYELMKAFKTKGLPEIGGVYSFEKYQLEGDDLVTKLALSWDGKVQIFSTDADFCQLLVHKNITLPEAKLPQHCEFAEDVRIYKTIVGDSGDNIKGLKNFGSKKWSYLSRVDITVLKAAFEHGDRLKLLHLSNQSMIDQCNHSWETLLLYWDIIGFIDISDEEVLKCMQYYPPAKINFGASLMNMNDIGVMKHV